MKDEEREIQGELVPVDKPTYDVVEQADDDAIIAMMTGQAIQEYVYSFKQGGKEVQGLTLAGINEAANRRGGIVAEDIQYEDRENSWLVLVKATDTLTGNSRYGAYEQSKKSGSREDPFAFTKAVHKAQRNAIKQLLPVPIIREVLNFYLQKTGQPAAVLPRTPSANDKITPSQKSAFAFASKLKEKLDPVGVSQALFWTYVKRRYNVESRNDMTERHWAELSAELNSASSTKQLFDDFVARIKKVIAAEGSSEVPTDSTDIVDAEVIEESPPAKAPATGSAGKPKQTPNSAPSKEPSSNESLF